MLGNRGSPEARSLLCLCQSLLHHDLCHGWSSLCWLPALRFRPHFQMRTKDPALTGEQSREGPHNSNGDWTFLRQHERVPEVPVVTREEPQVSCRTSRKTRRFSPQSEMRPFSTAGSREISYLPSCISKVSLTPLMQEVPQIPVSTREEHLESRHNSRRAPFFPPHLEMRVHFPASLG